MFAEVIFPQQKIIKTLTYLIPEGLRNKLRIGQAVDVPLRNSLRVGYVVKIKDKLASNCDYQIKEISDIKAEGSFFDEKTLELMEWMASYYVLPLYKILPSVLPLGLGRTKKMGKFFDLPDDLGKTINKSTVLNVTQKKIFNEIISSKKFYHLIHGVTGSGKTQIYAHLLNHYTSQGLSCILLIPEIGLSYQLYKEIKESTESNVFLLHSGLTIKERRETWTKIFHTSPAIVVGTRSAVFAPVKNLGCIIIDEEQDQSYKQEQTPRYNAKAIAFKRALLHKAKLILGSATPSVNTMFQAKESYTVHNLNSRYNQVKMPIIKVIDLKDSLGKKVTMLSKELQAAIHATLQNKEQVLVLYNQRGVSKFIRCEDCGEIVLCPSCSISLTLHQNKKMKCHYCGHTEEMVTSCQKCGSANIKKIGKGIQTLEKELKNTFGYAKIRRLDSDISSDSGYLEETLRAVREQEIDILVGTQMIAKGHHFPNVTMVAVIDADTSLFIPDIYSNERTFDLLVQVIGRAGREQKQGQVYIQTFHPEHYAIKNAVSQNYFDFYRKELEQRESFHLPPYYRIIRLYVENTSEQKAEEDILLIFDKLQELSKEIETTDPFPAMIYKLRDRFRWNIMIKYPNEYDSAVLKKKLYEIYFNKQIASRVYVDIDPISYL